MSENPIHRLLRALNSQEHDFSAHLESAAQAILEARSDPDRLDSYLALLTSAERDVGGDAPSAADQARLGVLRALELLTREVRAPHPVGQSSLDVAALAASVRTRANALPVLRQLSLDHGRWAEVRSRLEMHSTELSRVVDWARDQGLVVSWKVGRESHLRLSALGEIALRMIDEPAWLQPSASLVRITLQGKLRRQTAADTAAEAAEIVGLSVEAGHRCVDAIGRALDPANVSRFRACLAPTAGDLRGVVVIASAGQSSVPYGFLSSLTGKPWDADANPWERSFLVLHSQALLARTLERSGVQPSAVSTVSAMSWVEDRRPPEIRVELDRPVISMVHGISQVLLHAFGDPIELNPTNMCLSWTDADSHSRVVKLDSEVGDLGLVIRLYDSTTGVSHFVLRGIVPEGMHVALKGFYESVEMLLGLYPRSSFAALIKRMPRQGDPHTHPVSVVSSMALQTRDPEGPSFVWRWRTDSLSTRSGADRREGGDRRHEPCPTGEYRY